VTLNLADPLKVGCKTLPEQDCARFRHHAGKPDRKYAAMLNVHYLLIIAGILNPRQQSPSHAVKNREEIDR
jgi:hypothetical protein